jgi:predicted permease
MLRRRRPPADFSAEIEAHIALETERLRERGMGEEEARAAARRSFGNVLRAEERNYETGRWVWGDQLWQDVRHSLRLLRKSPGFTGVAVATLALGIGATSAIFSVLDSVILRPLPYPRPEQLVGVEVTPQALDPTLRGLAPEDLFVFHEQSRTFQDIGLYAETDTDRDVNVTGFGEPERVHAIHVTRSALSVLGVPALHGHIFSRADDSPGAPATALLAYGYWERHFGGDPAVVGKTILVEGMSREIIGVMPRSFRFLDVQDLALILPLQLDRNKTLLGNFSYFGVARLKAESDIVQAGADVARMLPIVLDSFPPSPGMSLDLLRKARLTPSLLPLKREVIGNVGELLWILMGGIGIVLLIACANVANLLLVRMEGQRHELSLRAALGASRWRLAVQLLVESAGIGALGGILGLGLAYGALRFLVALAPSGLPRLSEIGVHLAVLVFTLGAGIATSLLCGLIPVLRHAGVGAGLLESGRTLGLSRERHRARNLLVALQVGLALVLLISSGLIFRTFRVLTHTHPGFARPAELQTFRVSIPAAEVADDAAVTRRQQQIQEKLANAPAVSSVAFASAVPLEGDSRFDNVSAEDRAATEGAAPPLRHLFYVSPGYLRTMGIPLIAGRDFTWAEIYETTPVALVSQNLAHEYWRTPAAALGRRIRIRDTDDWREIVGVVGDVHDDGMDKPPRTNVYWPTLLARFQGRPVRVQRNVTFVVRSPLAGTEAFVGQLRRALWSVDPNLPLANVYTMNHLYRRSMARTSFTLVMLGIAGTMALLLGAVGLYGVMAYSVSRRTREIGIRMALGARRGNVLAVILGEGVLLIGSGLAIGLAGSFALTRLLSRLLFGVAATDPLTFAVVALLLSVVALAACYFPARRALRVDPFVALRSE